MEINELYDIFRKCGKVATDSRKVAGGELFLALKGENFDGNLYAAKALEAGAAYAVVDADSQAVDFSGDYIDASGRSRIIPVTSTLGTLQALARNHRDRALAADCRTGNGDQSGGAGRHRRGAGGD